MVIGLQVAAVYIGAVVGAGFASGQEIAQFFGAHGDHVLISGLVAGVLFAWVAAVVLSTCHRRGLEDYDQLARFALGERVGRLYEQVLTLCLLGGLAIMLAGAGALVHQELGWQPRVGSWLTAKAIFGVLLRRVSGVVGASALLIPVLIVVIVLTCVGAPPDPVVPVFQPLRLATGDHWLESAVLYVLYNSLLAVVVLAPVGRGGLPPGAVMWGSLVGGVGLGLMVALMAGTLIGQGAAAGVEVPMAAIAARMGSVWSLIYAGTLWIALLTTGVAAGLGLQSRWGKRHPVVVTAMCMAVAVGVAEVGFARLVSIVYPIMGYLALPLVVALIARSVVTVRS